MPVVDLVRPEGAAFDCGAIKPGHTLVAVNDRFGQSGTPAQLLDAYGLNAEAIVRAAERVHVATT